MSPLDTDSEDRLLACCSPQVGAATGSDTALKVGALALVAALVAAKVVFTVTSKEPEPPRSWWAKA